MPASSKSRRNSIMIAAAIAIALTAWILSGLGGGSGTDTSGEGARTAEAREMRVTVRHSTARETERTLTA